MSCSLALRKKIWLALGKLLHMKWLNVDTLRFLPHQSSQASVWWEMCCLNPVPDTALSSVGDCEESPDWLTLVSRSSLQSIGRGPERRQGGISMPNLQMEPLRSRVITVSAVCVGPLICSSYS